MELRIFIFTDNLKAFMIDYCRRVRRTSMKFIQEEQDLYGTDPERVLILKRMYKTYPTISEQDHHSSIQ